MGVTPINLSLRVQVPQPRSQGDKMRDPENEVAIPAPLFLKVVPQNCIVHR